MTRRASSHRPRLTAAHLAALALAASAALAPSAAKAQDVLLRGRETGTPPPLEIVRILAQDPTAFEFQRAWRARAAAVRARRTEIAATLGGTYTASQLAQQGAAITGVMPVAVIPVLYSDRSPVHELSEYQERLFGGGSGAVSVSELYSEMSGGVFTFSGEVLPWVTLSRPASDYEPSGEDDRYGNVAAFLHDALVVADDLVDFGQFDSDGPDGIPNSGDDDGVVDVAAFIYPSAAKFCYEGATGIWPHRWTYAAARYWAGEPAAPFSTSDPSARGGTIQVDDYIIQNGVECDGETLMGTGTISHELGHALDLPDLYDTDLEDGTESEGIGHWGLMGAGGWNRQMSPAHMSAWSKDRLGWLSVTSITRPGTPVSLSPIQRSRTAVRVDVSGSREYFLLANRQPLGSDRHLVEPGVLIWHIDPDRISERQYWNQVNADADHKGVDLEEADGRDDLDHSNNRGDAGDPFPGSAGTTEFTSTTYPGSDAHRGDSPCTVGVRSIRMRGSTASFVVNPAERLKVLGDADGSLTVDEDDVYEAYWYALGWQRPGSAIQVDNADVDGDGDVDIRDGFLIDAFRSGYRVPVEGMGVPELVVCEGGAPRARIALPSYQAPSTASLIKASASRSRR